MRAPTYTHDIDPPRSDGIDFRDFLRLLRRRGWIILVCLVVIPAAAYVYTSGRPKIFQAVTIVAPQSTGANSAVAPQFQPAQTNSDTVAAFVSTSAVANEAARRLGLPPGSLSGKASGTADENTGFVTITATGSTAKRAADTANAFAAALDSTQRAADQQRIAAGIAQLNSQLSQLKRTPANDPNRQQLELQLQTLQTLQRAQSQNVQVVQPAGGAVQVAPHPRRNATLALVLALLIGIGIVLAVERTDRILRKPEDLEQMSDFPYLGTIPHEAFDPERADDRDVNEAFQTLRNSLSFLNVDEPFRSIAVTSALKGEGKTTVALQLALAYARFGRRVLLVDTDLRKPDLATRTGLQPAPGLSDVLAGSVTVGDCLQEMGPFGPALRLLAAGVTPPNASALLGSLRMASLLQELPRDADIVIVDTTPLLVVSDAFPLLENVDALVAVTRLNQTPRDAIRKMLRIAESAGAHVAGIVATDATSGLTGYGYGYGYGAGYGSEPDPRTSPPFGSPVPSAIVEAPPEPEPGPEPEPSPEPEPAPPPALADGNFGHGGEANGSASWDKALKAGRRLLRRRSSG